MLTPIARGSARTKAVESVDVTFDITVNTGYTDAGSTADIVINPSDTNVKYWYLLLGQMEYDIYGAAMPDAAAGYLEYLVNYWSFSGYTPDMIYDLYSVTGRMELTESLEPKSNYWISAFAWDDEYLMWALVDYYDVASETVAGNQEKVFDNLDPNTEYVAIAFGFDGGSWTTGLTRVDFITADAGDPSQCTFDFRIENLKPRSVDITVVPSDPSVSYHWDLFEADMTEEEIRAVFQENIDNQIAMGYVSSALEYWQYTVVRGNNSWSWTTLAPNSSYKVMAVAIDMTTGEYATDFVFEEFSTPEAVVSDAEVDIEMKYYDGDALYEYDPGRYGACTGKAYTVLHASPAGPAAHYYYTIFTYNEGYEDPAVFSEEDIIYNLVDLQKGQMDTESAGWLLNWDTDYIIIGIAVDADGNYGNSYRRKFTPGKDGVSPIDEIVQSGRSSAATVSVEETDMPVVSARTLVTR